MKRLPFWAILAFPVTAMAQQAPDPLTQEEFALILAEFDAILQQDRDTEFALFEPTRDLSEQPSQGARSPRRMNFGE